MIVDCEKCEELKSCEVFWTNKESFWLCAECQTEHFPDAILWDKLISSAPDLLEACEKALAELNRHDQHDTGLNVDSSVIEDLEKATNKAKGK